MDSERGSTLWYIACTRPLDDSLIQSAVTRLYLSSFLIITSLNLFALARPTLLERILASGLIVIATFMIGRWLCGRDHTMPLLPLVGILYVLYYAVPVFLLRTSAGILNTLDFPTLSYSLMLTGIGLLSVFFGYNSAAAAVIARQLPRLFYDTYDSSTVRLASVALILAGMLGRAALFSYMDFGARAAQVSPVIRQLLVWVLDTPMLGLALLYALALSGNLGRAAKWFLWASAASFVWLGFAAGALSLGFEGVLPLLIVHATITRKIPWKWLALGLLALVILQPAKTEFRKMKDAFGVSMSPIVRAQMFVGAVQAVFNQQLAESNTLSPLVERMNLITVFAFVTEMTPQVIPYWDGHTYYPVVTKLIPRLIDPNKANEYAGQEFPHRYGLIRWQDTTTAFKLPQLIEAYINFGVPGVVAVMFIIGIIYRSIQAIFIHPRMGIMGVAAAAFVFSKCLDIEGNFSLVFGGLTYAIVYCWLADIAMRTLSQT